MNKGQRKAAYAVVTLDKVVKSHALCGHLCTKG